MEANRNQRRGKQMKYLALIVLALMTLGCQLDGYTSPDGTWYPSIAAYEQEQAATVVIYICWNDINDPPECSE